jgi:phage terminase large subunit-like protein
VTASATLLREAITYGTPGQKARMRWLAEARPKQLPPTSQDWDVWLYMGGRGVGKTRSASEWLAEQMRRRPGTRWAIVAPTFSDGRDVCVEGKTGLLAALAGDIELWNRSQGHLIASSGAQAQVFPAEVPDRLRGPSHDGAWCDELAAWRYPDAWDQLQYTLRDGDRPQTVVTTTPRPVRLVRQLVDRAAVGDGVILRRESTFDNAANLAPAALAELRARYEGTRLGRQELYAELLLDVPGALWQVAQFDVDGFRVGNAPELVRAVVAVDPAVTSEEDSDATGIVAVGLGVDGDLYVLADRTVRASPDGWARVAVDLYDEVEGDRIVAEVNNGGDLVETVLRTVDHAVPYRKVTASRGKRLRAEPVAALYEQGRVHHVGQLGDLEEQMVSWTPEVGWSPDRLDALVWAVTDLVLSPVKKRRSVVVAA